MKRNLKLHLRKKRENSQITVLAVRGNHMNVKNQNARFWDAALHVCLVIESKIMFEQISFQIINHYFFLGSLDNIREGLDKVL